MNPNDPMDPKLSEKLAAMQPIPDRNPEKAAQGRQRFVEEASKLANKPAAQSEKSRLTAWMHTFLSIFTILPGQFLYPIKLWSEDIRIGFTGDALAGLQLKQALTNRRVVEIQTLVQAGSPPPGHVLLRYQSQLEGLTRAATGMPAHQAEQALEQTWTQMQNQQQTLAQLQASGDPQAEAALVQARQMVQEQLQQVEAEWVERILSG